jgi:hypothetical protein
MCGCGGMGWGRVECVVRVTKGGDGDEDVWGGGRGAGCEGEY